MTTHFSHSQLERLRGLRKILLDMESRDPSEPAPSYWESAVDLELYDRVFAARIGWKWDAVIAECERRGALHAPRSLVDLACGTGIAARRVLAQVPGIEHVTLFDRDGAAREFARRVVESQHPGVEVEVTGELPSGTFGLALVSHVLDELDPAQVVEFERVLRRAQHVLWVEPGSRVTSRRLSERRDALLDTFDVVAPCTHSGPCGMLAAGLERHWCHLFAKPPAEVHTTSFWAEVRRELRIDLRSLPYSFLALRARSAETATSIDAARLLGRPRFERGNVKLDLCDADGVRQTRMLQRSHKTLFKELKKGQGEVVFLRESDGAFERVEPSAEDRA